MANDTKNFKVSEFACKHCGENNISQEVIDMAQIIRDELGVPVKINSGYRCAEHNKKVGGSKSSQHMNGNAADLSCFLGGFTLLLAIHKLKLENKLPMLQYCIYYPNKDFCHIDLIKRPNGKIFALSL